MSPTTPDPTVRPVEVVASYASYEEAERAVNLLAERGLPVTGVTIVAGDLRFVEQVTGRRGYGSAAVESAGAGALTGAFVGFVLGLFNPVAPLSASIALAVWGLALGAVIGAIVGLIGHAAGRRRDFSSVRSLDARRYDVMAPSEAAAEARRVLAATARRVA